MRELINWKIILFVAPIIAASIFFLSFLSYVFTQILILESAASSIFLCTNQLLYTFSF